MLCALAAGWLHLSQPGTATSQQLIPANAGLPWASGAVIGGSSPEGFAAWRGRAPDVRTAYFGTQTWSNQLTSARALRTIVDDGPGRLVVGLGMLPSSNPVQLEECAAGQFDANIQALTTAMLNQGARAALAAGRPIGLRLGWEADNTNGGFPWRATGDGTSWRDCFRRWVDILNPLVDTDGDQATPPVRQRRFVIVWNMANSSSFRFPIDNLWPGDDYVDIVGSQFFDRCPPLPAGNEVEWDKRLALRGPTGNPAGPQAWLDYARGKGKPYAVPEWGVGGPSDVCGNPGIDNPYFIRKMYEFFWRNAESIAFEAYFNGHGARTDALGSSMLLAPYPVGTELVGAALLAARERYNPLSAAVYRALWGAGVEPLPPKPPGTPPPATDTLYWLRYVASYPDLTMLLGTDPTRALAHWRAAGRAQGRAVRFDPVAYLVRNPELKLEFRNDWTGATRHYILTGAGRGL